jgi:hypothetical protein
VPVETPHLHWNEFSGKTLKQNTILSFHPFSVIFITSVIRNYISSFFIIII